MSSESVMQKKGIEMLIDTNPTAVTVSRSSLSNKDGAVEETISSKGPFNIALFQGPPRGLTKALRMSAMEMRTDKLDWCALAKSDADFKSGSAHTDTFTVSGLGTFTVHTVFPVITHGEVTGKFLFLEMFS